VCLSAHYAEVRRKKSLQSRINGKLMPSDCSAFFVLLAIGFLGAIGIIGVIVFLLNSLNSLSPTSNYKQKSLISELFLCDVRRQIRSIVDLCEEFGVRHTRTKRAA